MKDLMKEIAKRLLSALCQYLIRTFGLERVGEDVRKSVEGLLNSHQEKSPEEPTGVQIADTDKIKCLEETHISDNSVIIFDNIYVEFLNQELLRGVDTNVAREIYEAGHIVHFEKGYEIATQDTVGDEVYFIIDGKVSISINGIAVDTSVQGECVGEMVIFNAIKRRSAAIRAEERCTILVIGGEKLRRFLLNAQYGACLSYNLSKILASRLRKRSWLYRLPNDKPYVFIGSSSEAKKVAEFIDSAIISSGVGVTKPWTGIEMFNPSNSSMEDLEKCVADCDFAVLILSKDDLLNYRKKEYKSPRDNVVFELGYCMGKLGRDRAIFLVENSVRPLPTKLPSDIYGLTYIPFKRSTKSYTDAANKILHRIKDLGVRK